MYLGSPALQSLMYLFVTIVFMAHGYRKIRQLLWACFVGQPSCENVEPDSQFNFRSWTHKLILFNMWWQIINLLNSKDVDGCQWRLAWAMKHQNIFAHRRGYAAVAAHIFIQMQTQSEYEARWSRFTSKYHIKMCQYPLTNQITALRQIRSVFQDHQSKQSIFLLFYGMPWVEFTILQYWWLTDTSLNVMITDRTTALKIKPKL